MKLTADNKSMHTYSTLDSKALIIHFTVTVNQMHRISAEQIFKRFNELVSTEDKLDDFPNNT